MTPEMAHSVTVFRCFDDIVFVPTKHDPPFTHLHSWEESNELSNADAGKFADLIRNESGRSVRICHPYDHRVQ